MHMYLGVNSVGLMGMASNVRETPQNSVGGIWGRVQ